MNRQIALVILILVFPVIFIISCSKTDVQQTPPVVTPPGGGTTTCDTVNMKYSTDIVKIMQNHCYGCHGNGNTSGSGGINLDGYNNLSGYATSGTLIGVITHAAGFPAMPFQQPKLDDCTINKVKDWVNRGSLDN
jgi:hypothetical protein